jgi:TonB-dependent SusC/RagA subfamily outer membrane receptor
MLTIVYYFLQVVLCSGMMMGYYWLVLRNKRFHQYNRFYLLAAALLSWIVPLIKITWSQPAVTSEQPQVMQFLSVVADKNSQIEQTIHTQPVSEWSRELLLTGIYFSVAAILFFGMVRAFTKLYRLLRNHSCKNVGDIYLVLTQAKGTPFSFFRYIFWNEEIDIRSAAGKQILQHELTHVQQKHSFDKLLIQLMLIGGWFNPFFWLLRKEMDMIHEFIADKKAVNNGDTAALAQMLLTAAYPQQQFALTHPFFFSPIKRRLQMLTNNKNPRYSYIRRLVVLPLLAVVIVLFAFRSKERRETAEISIATVMENVAADQKQLVNSFLQGVDNLFVNKLNDQSQQFHSVFYNGRPLTVPASFRLKDLRDMAATNPHTYHLDLTPSLNQGTPDPLYVIDGKKMADKKTLDVLNPDDIYMIQVWKGADAVAKYGDAGKDGVIEITTKAFADRRSANGFSGLTYEGVARDPMGNIVGNRIAYLKVTIFQGETGKTKVWEETHVIQSNENGAFTFTLGKDVKSSTKPEGEMEKSDWTQGPYFVNLAAAIAPSAQAGRWVPQDNYVDYGTTRMMTIPFSLAPLYLTDVLIVIDGVVTSRDGLNMISPNDISSIDVLKDATAVEKYGSAAKNGVIEVITKSRNFFNRLKEAEEKNKEAMPPGTIADSVRDVKWQTVSGHLPSKKISDTSILLKGQQIPAKDRVSGDGIIRAEGVPITVAGKRIETRPAFEGLKLDNSREAIELKKRNPDVKLIAWRSQSHISIQLKDGTEETYNLIKPESKKRAETKYGKLPEPPPAGTIRGEVTVVGYGVRRPDKTSSRNITVPGAISGGTFSGTLSGSLYNTGTIPAEFPGGLSAWAKYLERNLDRDIAFKKGATPGRYTVVLLFDISEDGTISNVQAQNDPGFGTKEEAINLILKSPKWTPALKDGKRVSYTHKETIHFFVKDVSASLKPGNNFSLSLASVAGTDITIAPGAKRTVTVNIPGVKVGDPILVDHKDDKEWSALFSWVAEKDKVRIEFVNATNKELKISGSDYKIVVVKI